MIQQGLLQKFSIDAVYTLHNWPRLPTGHIAVNPGLMMAALDYFTLTLKGKSCHAAMSEQGADPMVAAAEFILAFQAIPSRVLSPLSSAVISVSEINGGEAINVIAAEITLCGTIRGL